MAIDIHTIAIIKGSQLLRQDRIILGLLNDVVYGAGEGPIATVPVATKGVGYLTIPTVAFSQVVAAGSGATALAVMGAQSAAVVAGGTGGAPGAVTLTGTTGTGTKFQATGTINGGGVLTGPLVVTVTGAYSAMPTSLAAEPVTGGGLTGATVSLVMEVESINVTAGGDGYQAGDVSAALTGGTPGTPATLGAPTVTSGSGEADIVPIAFAGQLPAKYNVQVTCSGAAIAGVSAKTNTGFTVTVRPLSGALAAGTMDIEVKA